MTEKIENKKCCCASGAAGTPPCMAEEKTDDLPKIPGEFPASDARWISGIKSTGSGDIPIVPTKLSSDDKLNTWKVRFGFNRMGYRVEPGLYAIGDPDENSPVFISANYKMSFDYLRSSLDGRDGWILVLDTRGVNVWCAAGKGTFGTEQVVKQIERARLSDIVSHKTLIVPQLGAPGVSAPEVLKQTGFSVAYGPVRSDDLPAYLDAGNRATPIMRRVMFPIKDRMLLVPIEIVGGFKLALIIGVVLGILSGLGPGIYSIDRLANDGLWFLLVFVGAFIAGAVLVPMLLPYLPGRAFSLKGIWVGLLCVLGLIVLMPEGSTISGNFLMDIGWTVLIVTLTSFIAMNFTGASTYTSLSGVEKEMKVAVPIMFATAPLGILLLIVGRFI